MLSIATITKHSKRAKHKQHKHVAVLVKGGAIVAVGYNHRNTHAEIKAIKQVWPDHREGLVLWSFRITNSGKLAMALPCPACTKEMVKNGITKVHYSDSDGQMKFMKLPKERKL